MPVELVTVVTPGPVLMSPVVPLKVSPVVPLSVKLELPATELTSETVPEDVVEVWLPVRSVRFVDVDGVLGNVGPITSEDEMVLVIVSGRIREPVSALEPVMETFEELTTVKTLELVTVLGPET